MSSPENLGLDAQTSVLSFLNHVEFLPLWDLAEDQVDEVIEIIT